jgi:hypothetical protein
MYYRKKWGDVPGLGNPATTEMASEEAMECLHLQKADQKVTFCKYILAREG